MKLFGGGISFARLWGTYHQNFRDWQMVKVGCLIEDVLQLTNGSLVDPVVEGDENMSGNETWQPLTKFSKY